MSTINPNNEFISSLQKSSSSRTSDSNSIDDTRSQFLTMLTTQLQNQDPMKPMENAEITSQLAQMETVDGIEKLNAQFQSLIDAQANDDAMQAAALVGRGVLVEGDDMLLTDAGGIAGYQLGEPADRVNVTIFDSNGLEVASMTREGVEAGSHNLVWDGTAATGEAAAPGGYRISVSAERDGEPVSIEALQFGQVTGVVRGPAGTDLQVGDLGIFRFDDIQQIL